MSLVNALAPTIFQLQDQARKSSHVSHVPFQVVGVGDNPASEKL